MACGESRLRRLLERDAEQWADNWRTESEQPRAGRWAWVNLEWIGCVLGAASL
ncbi:hypothetical protein [Nocardia transvalensis]|uniref:hypothetical protein n=1 Tax=Nocardia transvalensis TaxID=37333 RepID=UPI00189573E9|nr:hypothetical protein [Nocardia transvalensis]MBF6333270.1 hypothetical protein [Nocardia transvalensis]